MALIGSPVMPHPGMPRPVDQGFGPFGHPMLGNPNAGGPQRARNFPSIYAALAGNLARSIGLPEAPEGGALRAGAFPAQAHLMPQMRAISPDIRRHAAY